MPYKDPDKQKQAQHEWYLKNKDLTIERFRKSKPLYKERNKRFIRELKESQPCKDCAKKFPWYVMDYDHLRDKRLNLSHMCGRAYSLDAIKDEIAKCDLVCSNCHRERTYLRTISGSI